MKNNEIERKYKQLLEDVENNEFYKVDLTNRVNCYVCSCGHITKTKDVDPGVTPFLHDCEKCGQMAKSTFYRDIAPQQQPTQEWYRPTLEEVLEIKHDGLVDHILNGGLHLRKIKAKA